MNPATTVSLWRAMGYLWMRDYLRAALTWRPGFVFYAQPRTLQRYKRRTVNNYRSGSRLVTMGLSGPGFVLPYRSHFYNAH